MSEDHHPADLGHTFRVSVRMRGSSKVVGDLHFDDADFFDDLSPVEVRAWDLPSALIQAATLPFSVWFSPPEWETEHRKVVLPREKSEVPADPAVVEERGDKLFRSVQAGIRELREFMREHPDYKSPSAREALDDSEAPS